MKIQDLDLTTLSLRVPFKVSTQESAPVQFTASVEARIKIAPETTIEQLMELAARPRIITFANSNRPKGLEHLKKLHGTSVDIVLVPINARAEGVPSEDKAIDTLIKSAKAGKLTAEQKAEIARLLA